MLFERQRLLLTLLDALGGVVAHTDFQKLLLLYTHEWQQEPSYEFVPYHFGGFSFTSYADKRRLIERGLLVDHESQWQLSDTGRLAARREQTLLERTRRFAAANPLRGEELIAEVYRRHPYYATRSKVLNRVLPAKIDRDRVASTRPKRLASGLLTIGYEGRSLENFLNQLLRASVTMLCDVRRNPLSRKYGFAKTTLRQACDGVGIRYEHLPELGIASEERRDLKAQADYDALFAVYERDNLPQQSAALAKIKSWIEQDGERVALTCYEAEPCQCHRHCVAAVLERLSVGMLIPHHL